MEVYEDPELNYSDNLVRWTWLWPKIGEEGGGCQVQAVTFFLCSIFYFNSDSTDQRLWIREGGRVNRRQAGAGSQYRH